jgi:hypothetical protein
LVKFNTYVIICVFTFIFGITSNVLSAPEPSEVEEIKLAAPVHLIGVVKADQLFKDLSVEMGTNYQIRKMTLEVKSFIKSKNINQDVIDVFYSYIPSWQSDQWVGGKRVDIAKNDAIEIWLEVGEYGLEPALGGYTIDHLRYVHPRNEPLEEPVIHFLKRNIDEAWIKYSSFIVMISLTLIFCMILFSSIKKKEQPNKLT